MLLTPAFLCHKDTAQGTHFLGHFLPFSVSVWLRDADNRFFLCLEVIVMTQTSTSKVQPIRAQDLEGHGPMRVLHSGVQSRIVIEVVMFALQMDSQLLIMLVFSPILFLSAESQRIILYFLINSEMMDAALLLATLTCISAYHNQSGALSLSRTEIFS